MSEWDFFGGLSETDVKVGCFMAVVGALGIIGGVVYGIVWLFQHVTIV